MSERAKTEQAWVEPPPKRVDSWQAFEAECARGVADVVAKCRKERGYPNNVPPIALAAHHDGVACEWIAYVAASGWRQDGGDEEGPWTQIGLTLAPAGLGARPMSEAPGQAYAERGGKAPEPEGVEAFGQGLLASVVAACRSALAADPVFQARLEAARISEAAGPGGPARGAPRRI